MIPAAPGGLGTYELFGTEAFKLTGLAASSALALTVVIHAWVFVANILVGICLLAVKGISLAQLKSRLEVRTRLSLRSSRRGNASDLIESSFNSLYSLIRG